MSEQDFIKELSSLDINLTNEQINQLKEYCNLLIETNKITNLTAITEIKDIYLKHFLDSVLSFKSFDVNNSIKICDIGTGAGFPGVILKIVFPNLSVSLVDATKKKTDFLEKVINNLGLININVYNERIEDFAVKHVEEFDIVISRAVARLNVLVELSSLIIKKNGYFIAMKSNYEDELKQVTKALLILKMRLIKVIEYKLPIENSNRSLIKIEKIESTPLGYPRNFSKISKLPL